MEDYLVAYIQRPNDKEELFGALDYYHIKKLTILLKQWDRIDATTVGGWMKAYPMIDYNIQAINNLTPSSFWNVLKTLPDYTHIAMPLGCHRAFYKNVLKLRKQGKIIINISDGIVDCYGLTGWCFGFYARSLKKALQLSIVYFEHLRAKADVCFYQLYPLQSCHAKKTLPIPEISSSSIPDNIKEQLHAEKVDTLLVPGWGETIESLLSLYPDINSYCATSKERFFIINGKKIDIDNPITAELVITSNLVKKVIGTCSTAVVYAKLHYPQLDCRVVTNGELNKIFTPFYEFYYRKTGKRLGIVFIRK